MKEINSNTNKNYKLCTQLAAKKYRDKYGLYLIEGDNLISEAIKCNIEITAAFVREDYARISECAVPEPYILSKNLYDHIAQTETSQGIIAIVKKRNYTESEFFNHCKSGNILVLDRLQDPGNIGTMVRTADAAGYKGVIVIKGTGDFFSPKVVRAAAGSLFRLPVLFIDTAAEALAVIKYQGKKIVSTCFEAGADYFNVDLKSDVALLIGNEGGGLSREWIEGADIKVKIPMEPDVDSLNAAIAAGILMYESKRQVIFPHIGT